MAGPAPKTRDWSARENAHKPSGLHIVVYGNVEVGDANKIPVLSAGSGGPARTLALALEVQACSDPAVKAKVWKVASYHTEVKADEYEQVQILWDGKMIATVPVLNDVEHHAAAAKQTKALNASAPPPRAAKPKAKAAPKKAPAKKKPKAVGGWAKTAKKKTAKRAAKKSAKKPAKKSVLKRLVRKLVRTVSPKKAKKKGRR